MKLCPRLVKEGVFDKDIGSTEKKRVRLCETCPLWDEETQSGYCIYDRPGRISRADELELVKASLNEVTPD